MANKYLDAYRARRAPRVAVPTPAPVVEEPKVRRCSTCGEPGHTARTCKPPVVADSPPELTDEELEALTAPGSSDG
jgi:hypothetical protein